MNRINCPFILCVHAWAAILLLCAVTCVTIEGVSGMSGMSVVGVSYHSYIMISVLIAASGDGVSDD